jgi:hypothetical protein
MPFRAGAYASLLFMLVSACGQPVPPPDGPRARHLAGLKKITDECGLPASTFRLVGPDRVEFQPPPDSSDQSIICALTKLRSSGLPIKLGIVGNEAFAPGNSR